MEIEVWKPIEGYEDRYEISNLGRVKSLERRIRIANGSGTSVHEVNKFMTSYEQKQKLMKGQALNIIQRGEYYVPNIVAPKQEKIVLNKYGRMRLKYLKEHQKANYTIMLMDGTLNAHLKEIQETAQTRVEQIINQLKEKSDLTEDMKNINMLYWVGTMNSIKAQAEEIVFSELIYI